MGVKNTQFNVRGDFLGEYLSGKYVGYNSQQLGDIGSTLSPSGASGNPLGHDASGGIINDWLDPSPGKVYRTHI